ncbi:hypothetical protein [Flammeovirga agarivorans]|uniref:DNA polymerase III subunits gamma and tau n=1 Tax=Flammeovirga agarivorans TaxID=2726742 RepID=A0A7X8SLB1_9BACT|nr:hypothetical protein [Flammeovirga agarivorans]NLR92227.1 hypothetical protein [Flammeovirga agarivorans]
MRAKQAKLAKKTPEKATTSTQPKSMVAHLEQEKNKIQVQQTTQISGNLEQLKSVLSKQAKDIKAAEQPAVAMPTASATQGAIPPPPPAYGRATSNKKQESTLKTGKTFTLEQAQKVWKSFADRYRTNGKSKFASILLDESEISLDSQMNVLVHITNSLQSEHLNIVRSELLRQLRTDLQNDNIEISTKLVQVQESVDGEPKKLYNSQDKLAYLQNKFPSLKTLQQKLGLELD